MKVDRNALAALVIKAQRGNQNAFNELYRLTRERAYFIVYSITKNEQDALDLLQDSYLKAWQRLFTLQNPEQFPAWLNQIVGNTAKSFLRQKKPLLFEPAAHSDEPDVLEFQAETDTQYIPDASMDTEETRRLVMDIVDSLPEDQRLCILMYYYEEMPLDDIAAALDVPKGTVMSRLSRARKKISGGVEDLEKKQGVRLYGAAPVPLLLWFLRSAASPSSTDLPPVVLSSSAAAGAGILGTVALPKILAAIIAAVVTIGGAALTKIALDAKRIEHLPAHASSAAQPLEGSEANSAWANWPEFPAASHAAASDSWQQRSAARGANADAHMVAATASQSSTAAAQAEKPARESTAAATTIAAAANTAAAAANTAAAVSKTPVSYVYTNTQPSKATGAASTKASTTSAATTAAAVTTTTGTTAKKPLIPDPAFEAAIRHYTGLTGELTKADLAAIQTLTIYDQTGSSNTPFFDVRSLEGLEQMTSLETFCLFGNDTKNTIDTLHISGSASLTQIRILGMPIQNVIVSNCTNLKTLELQHTSIETLTIRGCASITRLKLQYNNLTALDVSGTNALVWVDVRWNCFASKDAITGLDQQENDDRLAFSPQNK